MNTITGKYAVVTGGTQGLGAAIVRQFVKAGAAGVLCCGRDSAKGEQVIASISQSDTCQLRFVRADLSSVDDCRAVIAAAEQAFGRVDILVNAAGVTDRGNIVDTSAELFDYIFAVNTRAPFFLMQDTVRLMIAQQIEGSIINIGSTSAFGGQPFISAYSASKGALATLTRNTAFALMRNRIRVNQLNIGWMATDGEDRIQRQYHNASNDWLQQASVKQPFGRLLQPEEVARAVTFLASDDSGMMTGSVVRFDQSVSETCAFSPPTPESALQLS